MIFFKIIVILLTRFYNFLIIEFNWFLYIVFRRKIIILTKEQTIQKIIDEKLSISRFGDGEFRLMLKDGFIGFQDLNYRLSSELISSYACRDKRILICTFDFREKIPKGTDQRKWVKWAITRYHNKIKKYYDYHYQYGNACLSRFYYPSLCKLTNFDYIEKNYVPLLKKIWEGRDVLIVEGLNTKLGCGNDLMQSVKSIRRIICPSKNAFNYYKDILSAVLSCYNIGDLVLVALGPTASVLCVDLTVNYNIQAIDIGHVDVVYSWFLNRSSEKDLIEGKDVNEASSRSNIISTLIDVDKYKKEIVLKILSNEL